MRANRAEGFPAVVAHRRLTSLNTSVDIVVDLVSSDCLPAPERCLQQLALDLRLLYELQARRFSCGAAR
jgi:hypothetical protein